LALAQEVKGHDAMKVVLKGVSIIEELVSDQADEAPIHSLACPIFGLGDQFRRTVNGELLPTDWSVIDAC